MVDYITQKMSEGLSIRHIKYRKDGYQLNDNSKISEKVFNTAMNDIIIPYCEKKVQELFGGSLSQIHFFYYPEKQKNDKIFKY